jgi:hypothetical protein
VSGKATRLSGTTKGSLGTYSYFSVAIYRAVLVCNAAADSDVRGFVSMTEAGFALLTCWRSYA